MENASKALLIAGGVLIAMIIASFGVYLYGVYHEHAENVMNMLTESQITEFNAKFAVYENRKLTVNELISVKNLAEYYKVNIQYSTGNGLDKYIKKSEKEIIEKYSEITNIFVKDSQGNILKDDEGNKITEIGYKYSFYCTIKNYDRNGMINNIYLECENDSV